MRALSTKSSALSPSATRASAPRLRGDTQHCRLNKSRSAADEPSSMGTTGALVFTGISSFSSDFQTILSREQQIEQIPITALKNQQSDLLTKKSQLISLNTDVGKLGSSIAALGSVAANQGISASSSDPTTVSVV